MSDQTTQEPKAPSAQNRPGVRSDSQGAGMKWLAGAAVAALVLGGGYYAVKNMPANQPNTEIAAYDESASTVTPYTASPASGATVTPESTTTAATGETTTTASTTPARTRTQTAARNDAVPEQVIGVTPARLTMQDEDELVITGARRSVWASTPSARRLTALYPARALERGREGEASISCTVQERGALECARVSETPASSGFGNAALRVARTFKHAPQLADGRSAVGTPVNLRVLFRIDDGDRRRT